jgi:hypothetical protein
LGVFYCVPGFFRKEQQQDFDGVPIKELEVLLAGHLLGDLRHIGLIPNLPIFLAQRTKPEDFFAFLLLTLFQTGAEEVFENLPGPLDVLFRNLVVVVVRE